MLRQNAYPRLSLAAESTRIDGDASQVRRFAAQVIHTLGRILLAPPALVVAALAGALFVILLPVCGIASVAEATARSSWGLVRGVFRRDVRADAQR